MKTLNTIQTLAKTGKVLSKIVFICCIVGLCGCVVGIISLSLGFESLKLGGVTIKSIVENESGMSQGTLYASLAVGAVFCIGEIILSRFAVRYFERELEDGTPFTLGGAKELLRLGILTICIPIATQIAAKITEEIFAHTMVGVQPLNMEAWGSVSLGVMMIILSLFCKYGAELTGGEERP